MSTFMSIVVVWLVWLFAAGSKATIRSSLRYKPSTLINFTLPLPYPDSFRWSPSLASGD